MAWKASQTRIVKPKYLIIAIALSASMPYFVVLGNFIGTNNEGISRIKMNFIYLNYFVITSCSKMLQKYAMSFIHKEIKILFCSFESGRSASKLVHFFSVKTLAKQPPL